jgi:hypothetical protein
MIGSDLHAQLVAARVADLRREADARALVRAAKPTRARKPGSWPALITWRRGARVGAAATVPACC